MTKTVNDMLIKRSELTDKKRELDYKLKSLQQETMKSLVADRAFDCFSINYSAVRRAYGNIQNNQRTKDDSTELES